MIKALYHYEMQKYGENDIFPFFIINLGVKRANRGKSLLHIVFETSAVALHDA